MALIWNFMKCLNEDAQKEEKGQHFLYIGGQAVLITMDAKLLDTKYELYRFNDDLKTTLTNEYHCQKASFHRNKYRLCCYV